MRTDIREIDEAVYGTHSMINRDVTLQAELVEQRPLRHLPLAHHRAALQPRARLNQDFNTSATPTFSTVSAHSRLWRARYATDRRRSAEVYGCLDKMLKRGRIL